MSKAGAKNPQVHEMVVKERKNEVLDCLSDLENETKQGKEDVSDCETVTDSLSSQGESQTITDNNVEMPLRVEQKKSKKNSKENSSNGSKARKSRTEVSKSRNELSKKHSNTPHITLKKSGKSNLEFPKVTKKSSPDPKPKHVKVHPKASSESSEGLDDKSIEEVKEFDILEEAANDSHGVESDNESANRNENGSNEDQKIVQRSIEGMELKIEKLEEELREIAALEISLYSVVPEHGSSAHKVHTPARRLSRLYIHACKHWSQDKRATIARNTISGLVMIAKACGNDVPRLTFWLSNTVVLREVISQAFGNSVHSSTITKTNQSNSGVKRSDEKSPPLKWKGSPGSQQVKMDFTQFIDEWQETKTFTSALEKVESWIFSRIVESVWWQTLTPHMQSSVGRMYSAKSNGKVSGSKMGDQQQGDFAINLWQRAFQDAFQRLCPLRAGGHECGCLPVLARMVMEQCVARLDVAMFNAILRESEEEIPTDPISDPIVDSRVLPIPSGNLSFGSGAQLKNSVGNWSRMLTDLFGMDTEHSLEIEIAEKDANQNLQSFRLLNALSDLLMLPKDMLMDRSIRKEVCPSIGLPLIIRILCNFLPDEFCPDHVPGAVLEALNSESFTERRFSDAELGSNNNFPYGANPVVYSPPSPEDVAEKVGENTREKSQLGRNVSILQRKGYTSDEELEELESPLTSIIDKMSPASTPKANGNGENLSYSETNIRYHLLREVWTECQL